MGLMRAGVQIEWERYNKVYGIASMWQDFRVEGEGSRDSLSEHSLGAAPVSVPVRCTMDLSLPRAAPIAAASSEKDIKIRVKNVVQQLRDRSENM